MRIVVLSSLALLTACTKYVPVQNATTAEKVWIMSQDSTEIYYCSHEVSDAKGHDVRCMRARIVGARITGE